MNSHREVSHNALIVPNRETEINTAGMTRSHNINNADVRAIESTNYTGTNEYSDADSNILYLNGIRSNIHN